MEFDPLDHRAGLEIFDPIEKARFELYTDERVDPEPTSTDGFHFPVGSAVEIETATLGVPNHISAMVWTGDGDLVSDETNFDHFTPSPGTYLLELQSTPMKLYVRVDGEFELNHADGTMSVTFEDERPVTVGARSLHERPEGTITVPDDVQAEMDALSLFGSALKTTSCERSFPTLRGHPPLVEHGDAFEVPAEVEQPDTGVELVLPPDREYVYPAASLAYYLGADLVAGSEPRLVASDFEHSLAGEDGYEATVNRVLKQVFFLDCLTRTEGYYPVDLHERAQVEPRVDLDFETLYERPIAGQLPAYLSVPFETLEPHLLDWHLTTDVVPTSEHLPALPYFARELSLFRTPPNPVEQTTEPTMDEVEDFMRSTETATATGGFTRSTSEDWDFGDELFQAEPVDTMEHAWVGGGYPLDVNKVRLDALRRRVDRTAPTDSVLEVHVVNNDPRMDEELAVGEFYGLRDMVRFEVSIHETVSTDELAALFESDADFLHYIGHVDEDGFLCADGYLDANSLSDVNVDAFFLNACQSYRQGELLVEKGSYGGVVTIAEVVNERATKIGQSMARLLNAGFSLRAALNVATGDATGGIEYLTLGDGGLTLCQGASGVPTMYRIHEDEEEYRLEHVGFPTANFMLGTVAGHNFTDASTRYLASGSFAESRISATELNTILDVELLPVEFDGDLYWSDEISVSDL